VDGVVVSRARIDDVGRNLLRLCEQPAERRTTPPVLTDGLADHDPVEPGSEGIRVAQRRSMTPCLFERGLDSVTGVGGIPADQPSEPGQTGVMRSNEGVECRLVQHDAASPERTVVRPQTVHLPPAAESFVTIERPRRQNGSTAGERRAGDS